MLLKENLGRCLQGAGRKGAAPGSPRAVSAGSGLVLRPERQGAQGGPVSGSDSCLGSSLWGLGTELGSRGAETDVKTEEGTGLGEIRTAPCTCEVAEAPWTPGRGAQLLAGGPRRRGRGGAWTASEEGLGSSRQVSPEGQKKAAWWLETQEAGFGSGQKSQLRFLAAGREARCVRRRQTDRTWSQKDSKAPSGRFGRTGTEGRERPGRPDGEGARLRSRSALAQRGHRGTPSAA